MDVSSQTDPPVLEENANTDQQVEGVPISSVFAAATNKIVTAERSETTYCNLRSTIPLRLDRKPPCRPVLLPTRLTDIAAAEQDKSPNSTPPLIPTPPPVPLPPPPVPPKRPPPPSPMDIHSQGYNQSHAPAKIGVPCNNMGNHGCMCCYARERGGRVPFNGVPPLLAVITQDEKKDSS